MKRTRSEEEKQDNEDDDGDTPLRSYKICIARVKGRRCLNHNSCLKENRNIAFLLSTFEQQCNMYECSEKKNSSMYDKYWLCGHHVRNAVPIYNEDFDQILKDLSEDCGQDSDTPKKQKVIEEEIDSENEDECDVEQVFRIIENIESDLINKRFWIDKNGRLVKEPKDPDIEWGLPCEEEIYRLLYNNKQTGYSIWRSKDTEDMSMDDPLPDVWFGKYEDMSFPSQKLNSAKRGLHSEHKNLFDMVCKLDHFTDCDENIESSDDGEDHDDY